MSVQGRCGAIVLLALLITASMAQAQEFTGTYVISGEAGVVSLTLEQDESGAVQGQMTGAGMVVQLQGGREDPGISGLATSAEGETYGFVAQLGEQDGYLYLKLFPFDYAGNPLYDYAETLVFAPQAAGEAGAWGVEGGPTLGFILPNLDLPGPMPADISGGGTGIFINGREIHVQDQMALHQVFGVTIPGRYWLDAQGHLGIEGGMVIANLAAAMQAAAGRGYGSATGAGGTVGSDSPGFMFSARTLDRKSVFWYSGM
jgi:hypothetical protein